MKNPRALAKKDTEAGRGDSPATHAGLDVSDVLDALPFYVILVDENHRILQANSAVREQLRLEPEAIVGQYCPKIIHGLDEPWYACPLEEAAAKGRAIEKEALDRQSGRWIRSAVYPAGRLTADGRRVFVHMVVDITDRKQAETQLRASRDQLRQLSAHLESVREEERGNVAREIHDELGQMLTALKIDLAWLRKRLPPGQRPVLEKAESMYELIDTTIRTVQRISLELRPGVLDDLGLAAAIEWQGAEFEKRTGIKFEFVARPETVVLDGDRSTTVFRILQETLTNVVRHAHATRVRVVLEERQGEIVLTIRDNGKGIEKAQLADPKAFGVLGMKERAQQWGGRLAISGRPGKGTTVVAAIPLASRENHNAQDTHR